MKKTTLLVVLDGWGIGESDSSNPIYMADLKFFQDLPRRYPAGALQASGIAVGLPWEEEGNSEVGHLTLGTGSVLYQHFPRITLAIQDGTFYKNEVLREAFLHAKKTKGRVHVAGLLSKGNVHSAYAHLQALMEFMRRESVKAVTFHLFTDGRDSAFKAARDLTSKFRQEIAGETDWKIGSMSGRYYAMDRDQHWERTERAYEAMTGGGMEVSDAEQALEAAYARDVTDEYIEPVRIKDVPGIKDDDTLIFFNFREDRMREMTKAFSDENFDKFGVKKFKNIRVVTFTLYGEFSGVRVAFTNQQSQTCLSEILSKSGKTQLHIAETEKYAHVTYFFNGLKEESYPEEYRVLIPSRQIARHDEHPEMMAEAITDRVTASLKEGVFDFILVNYANADIVAHTGNFDATVAAVRVVEAQLKRLLAGILEGDHQMLMTSDHGNAEVLLNLRTGEPETKHNTSPVPVYLIGKSFEKRQAAYGKPENIGFLSDVAPTILELMGIEKPQEMTGQSLLRQLQ